MECHVAYICFSKGHRQSEWCKWRKTWILLFPLHHQTSPVPIVALMVAWHLHLSCFAMLASCHFFSVRPSEMSPCTALKNRVLHNMSFTQTKWNEKYNNNQAFKRRTMENQPNNQTLLKKTLWKINPIDQKLHYTTPLVYIHKTCKAPS